MPTKDKLELVRRVYELRVQRCRIALQVSQQALESKRQDIVQLQALQREYQQQIEQWQSGRPQDLLARRAMLASLAPMLHVLQLEAVQLQQASQRCANQLQARRVAQQGLHKLRERRQRQANQEQRRKDRMGY